MRIRTADQLNQGRKATVIRSFEQRAKIIRQRTRLGDEPSWVKTCLGPRYNNLIRG